MQHENGHPDFEYSRRKFAELDIEEQRRSELIKEALDRMNAHYRGKRTTPTFEPTYEKPKTRKPFPVKKIIGLSLAVLMIGALLWYAPTIISFIKKLLRL